MRAAYIESFAPNGNIKVGDLPKPHPETGEVCIKVAYAGVNPVDGKIAEGKLQTRLPHQFPLILGWEACGTVDSLGAGVTSLKVGDIVYLYCRKPVAKWGSWAEYLTYTASEVALAPKRLTQAQSGGVPLGGLTAWQGLFEKLDVKPKEWVLIHGGAGGVGGFAIQWAKIHGCRVITTASPSKFDYVKKLGADEVIDYKKGPFVEQLLKLHPGGVDAVYDTIGGKTYKESYFALKPKGCLVSILEQPDVSLAQERDVEAHYLFVQPNGKQLEEMAHLFEKGLAIPPSLQILPLSEAAEAIDQIRQGHTTGKIILQIG